MDPLNFLTNEQLIRFFRCKKTEMSCIEEPNIFLNQLRDHNLVPEKIYKKVIRMRCKKKKTDCVYDILDLLEKDRSDMVRVFWTCVFQDHMLQKYPVLRVLRHNLMDDPPQSEENTAHRKVNREKSVDETEEDEQPGPSSSSTTSHKKKTLKKPIFSSPAKRGEKLNIWTWPLFKTPLPVTCGNEEATLYRDKLARGGTCILSQGRWFTPSDFEKFAGKGSSKNWKLSIRCQNIPLQKLIEDGYLKCPRMKRKAKKRRRQLSPVSSSESSSHSYSEEMEEQRGEQEEEDEFQTPSLPVSCGSVSGILFKSRFASGTRSKSIRTEKGWFTPAEFVKQELTLPDGNWKRDIKCHGKMLNSLLQKILKVHSVLCKCHLCNPTEQQQLEQNNDDVCFICNSEGDLLCCDDCPRAFHHHCHIPALQDNTLGEKWMCTYCVLKTNQRFWRPIALLEEEALNCPVSQYIMHCEYLLLCMYKEDTQCMFSKDPSTTAPGFRNFISSPMWLDRMKEKLHSQEYETLRHFVSDARLIFQNCNAFNRGSDLILTMGSTLSQTFEQEFRTIFNIQ